MLIDDERSRWRCCCDTVGTNIAVRYGGAMPCWHLYASTPILKSIRWHTGNQWRSRNVGVMASYLLAPTIKRAAAFCMDCRRFIWWPVKYWKNDATCRPRLSGTGSYRWLHFHFQRLVPILWFMLSVSDNGIDVISFIVLAAG